MAGQQGEPPHDVAIVGAGVVGLATAWFLQEHGIHVTVLDRTGVAAGASWGNAGWLMAGDATPLPSPDVLREGIRGLVSRSSALRVPLVGDPGLYRFLLHFARHCTSAQWERSLRALIPISNRALDAYDSLAEGGVAVTSTPSTHHLTVFTSTAGRDAHVRHLEHLRALGSQTEFVIMDGDEARDASPLVSEAVVGAVGLRGQRYVDPTAFVPSLAESVVARGGVIQAGADVRGIRDLGQAVELMVTTETGTRIVRHDAVVVCTGAWVSELVGRLGVRVPVRAGRGYSFSAALDVDVKDPVYLPSAHLACTPMRGRLRIAGTMEIRPPAAPMDHRCIELMVAAARQVLRGVDLDDRRDEWVGPRPVTADGRPLAGPTRSPRIWCVGGHAMEGMVLGPATARLASEALASGVLPELLRPFDPLR